MEASKCPNCGEEPNFLEHMEKWYCYECNSYVDEPDVQEESTEEIEEETTDTSEESAQEATPDTETPMEEQEEIEVTRETIEVRICPNCEQPLKWIEKYQRYYCYSCKKYAPVEKKIEPEIVAEETPEEAPADEPKPVVKEDPVKSCPVCSNEMKFIEKYSEWYCHVCKKYPFHKPKNEVAKNVQSKKMVCPKCSGPLRYIEKYGRHYCNACKAYAPKAGAPTRKKLCPTCKSELKYIKQYNEWYCFKCKKYPLRPTKPVLLL
ncbi:MAG: hypothetical protein JSV94_00420 [Methanobacteriota archaeon]|nr:MAG: hypothetical protein JSV94_00420 [Euryarchaeota archaeon]